MSTIRHAIKPEELPCGGCSYCRKKHQEWSKFIDAVDTAVPLTSTTMKIQQIYAKPILACWIQGYTWKEIGEMQREDKELKFIFNWLKKQEVPNEDELFLSSPATKNYWINKELLFLAMKLFYGNVMRTLKPRF